MEKCQPAVIVSSGSHLFPPKCRNCASHPQANPYLGPGHQFGASFHARGRCESVFEITFLKTWVVTPRALTQDNVTQICCVTCAASICKAPSTEAYAAHGDAPISRFSWQLHDRYAGCAAARVRSDMRPPDSPLAVGGLRLAVQWHAPLWTPRERLNDQRTATSHASARCAGTRMVASNVQRCHCARTIPGDRWWRSSWGTCASRAGAPTMPAVIYSLPLKTSM